MEGTLEQVVEASRDQSMSPVPQDGAIADPDEVGEPHGAEDAAESSGEEKMPKKEN